jgi:hypothetical protein
MTPNVRWAAQRVREHATGPVTSPPPADEHVDRILYGLTRPIVGVRLLLGDLELLKGALFPAAILACVCVWGALIRPGDHGFIRRFYELFATLAPMPSIFMARHYARLAAEARVRIGYGPALPCYEPIMRSLWRLVARAILIGLAVAPLALLSGVPVVGHLIWKIVLAVWALHWIVVDAFDSSRVLRPGQTLADVDAQVDQLPSPWFVRLMRRAAVHLPIGGRILNWLARVCDRLAKPWRDELALVEQHPTLMVGFALSTALVLATPVLNLLFRPIVLMAATHVLGRLGEAGAADDLVPKALPASPASEQNALPASTQS